MQGFEDVTLKWDGVDHVVPANQVFDLVRQLEATIMGAGDTPAFVLLLQNRVPQSTLALAYAQALQYAGAKVQASEIYLTIMQDFASNQSAAAEKLQAAVVGLLSVISPPLAAEVMKGEDDEDDLVDAETVKKK